jgi:hypothetical protein
VIGAGVVLVGLLFLPGGVAGSLSGAQAGRRRAAASSRSVRRDGAQSLPRFRAAVTSARHAFAALSVANVFRTFRVSASG